jgi:hypothetical protein
MVDFMVLLMMCVWGFGATLALLWSRGLRSAGCADVVQNGRHLSRGIRQIVFDPPLRFFGEFSSEALL